MAGSSKTQTQTTSNAPWKPSQEALKTGLTDAQNLYKSGVGGQTYTGSTVIPFSQQTTQGMGQMENNANASMPAFQQNFGNVAANMNNGGLNGLQQDSVARLYDQANGSMMGGNPYLDQVISRASQDVTNGVNLNASAAGRYGSTAHQGQLTDAIGDMASQMRMQDYGTERGYMQDAIGSLFNAGQQQQDNINQGSQALGNAYQAMMQPSQSLMDVGGNYEDLATRLKNDELRIFEDAQNSPWDQIARLNAVAGGAGQMGSTGSTTAQGPSRLASGLGGAVSGYGMFGPLGGLAGGLAGAFL